MDPALTALKDRLTRAGFHVLVAGPALTASRPRRVPRRGLLRLLIPHALCTLRPRDAGLDRGVRPDGLAILMTIVCLGGLAVELTMPRATYPRDYPPAFVYGLSAAYLGLLLLELRASRRALSRALAQHLRDPDPSRSRL